MTFEQSIPLAKTLAENQLQKGFDVEAFLILCEIQRMNVPENNNDFVPESNIDECIDELLQLFITYYNNKSVQTLTELLETLRQILSELYHSCETQDEKSIVHNFILNINKVVTN